MFANRPALNKEASTPVQQSQTITKEHKNEFVTIRDAVQKELLENSKSDSSVDPEIGRASCRERV